MPAAPATLPTYALYGEPGRTQATDWLHCERIAERSRRHDWEIRPHRHASLFQILHIEQGSAQAALEAGSQALAGPCVMLVPALVPHGFVFSTDVQGTVVTVLEQHLLRLLQPAPLLAARLVRPQLLAWPALVLTTDTEPAGDGPPAAQVQDAVTRLRQAFADTGAWRDLALDAALLQLAVVLGRLAPDALPAAAARAAAAPAARSPASDTATTPSGQRALAHVQRYRALVEARFRQQPALADLAAELGISPTQLNRVCRQVLGHPALALLHDRLVLEAQRDLAYTTLSIKQIGGGLGFVDPGYFTRFFQHRTGHTPTAWRALAAR